MADVTTLAIADFLLARIAEDEKSAGRIASTPREGVESAAEQDYFRLTDPARVRAECEAKRRIVERTRQVASRPMTRDERQSRLIDHEQILREMSAVYANHPGFNDSWHHIVPIEHRVPLPSDPDPKHPGFTVAEYRQMSEKWAAQRSLWSELGLLASGGLVGAIIGAWIW